jgi:hypothetical protein
MSTTYSRQDSNWKKRIRKKQAKTAIREFLPTAERSRDIVPLLLRTSYSLHTSHPIFPYFPMRHWAVPDITD